MAEVDPVVLQLRAELDQYLSALKHSTRTVDQQLGLQERRVRKLEAEMRASSSRIAIGLKSIAGTIGTYFTGREVIALADNFTRLQNELRVAGLEGEALTAVQERLFSIANDNGAAINSLAELYGKSASAARDFGASQEQMLTLTEASALSLRISGTNAQAASGALLGLSQALASGTVRAEEFNQMNEGGLRPLLQAAAASDRFGGSLGKLRNAVVEGELSSRQFFDAVLSGTEKLRTQAADATLTLAGAFTVLQNNLISYVGGTASATGATGVLADGIKLLADNLDTVFEALAVIAVFMGGRYIASMVAAGAATATTSNIIFAMQARALGAATTMEALAFASRAAGASMLAAFGGPVGVALIAAAAAIYLVHKRTNDLDEATGRYAAGLAQSNQISSKAAELSQKLASARGIERAATLEALRIERARAQQALVSAKNDIIAARAALARAEAVRAQQSQQQGFGRGIGGMGMDPGGISTSIAGIPARQATANLAAAEQTAKNIEAGLDQISSIISGASAGAAIPSAGPGSKTKPNTGPSEAEIAARFSDELDGYRSRMASAQAQIARSAEERAELELKQVDIAERSTIRSIDADAHYSDADKRRLTAAVEMAAVLEREAIDFQKRAELEREAADIADEQFRARADALSLQYDLADTESDRKRLALEIIDAETEYLRSKLEAVRDSQTAADAEKERARIALDSLNATAADQRAAVARANETDVERYLRDLRKSPEQINEAFDDIRIDGLEALNDELTDAIMGAQSLGDAFEAVADQIVADLIRIAIQQALIRPMAESLFGGGGGGGGGLLNSILSAVGLAAGGGKTPMPGGLKGFASGGSMMIGGRGGVDNNVLSLNDRPVARVSYGERLDIVPNQALARGSQAGGVALVKLQLDGDIDARIVSLSGPVAVEVVKAYEPALTQAAVNETFRVSNRPRT
jgi:tape measure domain-containing protein